eukprot:GCRY01000610.1.p1 GENE.GCRY01000610.1~~GCRY01000610.1.p1  ORF type:complete len:352 (-),score=40.07 GCRY01000610.1:425-1480(-)
MAIFTSSVTQKPQNILFIFLGLIAFVSLLNLKSSTAYDSEFPRNGPWRIAIVSDMDTDSKFVDEKGKTAFKSILRYGTLVKNEKTAEFKVEWDQESVDLVSTLSEGGRGMELSELCYFDGHLFAVDDRTGIIYEIINGQPIAKFILREGDGNVIKGYKSEWCAVKDNLLYISSTGKEWTTETGEYKHDLTMWVKTVDSEGRIQHLNWKSNFNKLREVSGTTYPGYLLHEACAWNPHTRQWVFAPRRISTENYDDQLDEERCGNTLFFADEDFDRVFTTTVGELNPIRGYSSIKFLPDHPEIITALKTVEYKGTVESFITVFTVNGEVLMEDELVADVKMEGLEFLPPHFRS